MICPLCHEKNVPEGSRFCHMCGCNLKIELQKINTIQERKMRAGELPLADISLITDFQAKKIQVICADITKLNEPVDLLTISAGTYNYQTTSRSVIGALYRELGLMVADLAKHPPFDLRKHAGCWISEAIEPAIGNIHRIGCVEIQSSIAYRIAHESTYSYEKNMITALKSYLRLIDILADQGIPVKTIAIPFLGTGDLHLNQHLIAIPLINEVTQLLKRNPAVEKVIFIERNYEKAKILADSLCSSYKFFGSGLDESADISTSGTTNRKPFAFISYTENGDRSTADLLCQQLKHKGIDYWYAVNDIKKGDYASAIVNGIKKCTHFICIISQNSMQSEHVLNEIDLAFQRLHEGIQILPFRLDQCDMAPSFYYYLSRMQWNDGSNPPIEQRINEFIDRVF